MGPMNHFAEAELFQVLAPYMIGGAIALLAFGLWILLGMVMPIK